MRILDIALKDLRQVIRDKKSLLFLVLMPIAFTLLFGFAFRSVEKDPRLPVGWVDRDPGGALSARLRDLVAATAGIRLVPLEGDEAARSEQQVHVSSRDKEDMRPGQCRCNSCRKQTCKYTKSQR